MGACSARRLGEYGLSLRQCKSRRQLPPAPQHLARPVPTHNTATDGYAFTSPAHSFAANGYGLYGMASNVWDWKTALFRIKSLSKSWKAQADVMHGYRLIKGGSYLCHASYCTRYRITAFTVNSPESSTGHTRFRIVFDYN